MHIIPEIQGNGIGRWILENVINEAKQNRQTISVSVLKNNPAKRLYERVGFEIYGEANQRYLLRYKEKVL